jgi:hypothetical protein
MIKFRWHRGTLEESMATAMEFDSLQAMVDYLNIYYSQTHKFPYIYTTSPYGYNSRVNQYLTGVKLDGDIIGFIFEEDSEDVVDTHVVEIKE